VIAVASNKQYISLYVMATVGDGYLGRDLPDRLPKANIGRSCVRFRRLEDLDRRAHPALREGAEARAGLRRRAPMNVVRTITVDCANPGGRRVLADGSGLASRDRATSRR
jgi:hypothetical protein